MSVAALANALKANSSRWIHETVPDRSAFAWQSGYGGFSVSKSHARRVAEYIDRQESHHRTVDYRTELLAFLDRHGIEFDERYLWS